MKLLFVVYPLWFMWPVLSVTSTDHLGVVGNDINLTIENVQELKRMFLPWSPTFFRTFPDQASFWRVEHLVDVPQKSYFWIMTRLFEPTFVVNTYQLIGMFLVGLVAYLLCRKLEINRSVSLVAGICAQALPSVRQMMLTGVAANQNVVFPIVMILALSRDSHLRPLGTRVLRVFAVLGGAFITSAYMFNYCLLIAVAYLLYNFPSIVQWFRGISTRLRGRILIASSMIGTVVIFCAEKLRQQTLSENGRPYGVYSLEDVFKDVYTLRGFITPDKFHLLSPSSYWEVEGYSQQYGGAIFSGLALLSVGLLIKLRHRRQISFIIFITVLMITLSLGRFQIGDVTIPAAREYLRYVMVGNRRYAIAGMIAQVLIVVLAAYVLNSVVQRLKYHKLAIWIAIMVLLVGMFDINPGSRRFVYAYADQYSEIRNKLNSVADSAIYISPLTERDKNFYVFDYPIYRRDVEVFANASIGAQNLANFLNSKGVKFVLALVNDGGDSYITGYIQNSVRFTTVLPPSIFVPVARDLTLQSTSDEGVVEREWTVRLVQIQAINEDSPVDFPQLAQFVSQPILEVARPDIDRRFVQVDWATAPEVVILSEALPSEVTYAEPPEIEFVVTVIPPPGMTSPINLTIESPRETISLGLEAEPVTVRVRSRLYEQVVFKTDSVCSPATDPSLGVLVGRPICYGISNFAVLQRR